MYCTSTAKLRRFLLQKTTKRTLCGAQKTIKTIANDSADVSNSKGGASPLQGVRVLDLTRIVAGPYCTMLLGDLGAEIIKIESLKTGDEARTWGPRFANNNEHLQCYFVPVNRNKKSVCVNLKTGEGRGIVRDLARVSDVFVENFVPGKLEEFGLGYMDLREVNGGLVYCSISGYGARGPYRFKPGYDGIAAAEGGMLHITGAEDGEPAKTGIASIDLATGLYAHGAILAALYHRRTTGVGQKIDCDLLSTAVAQLINVGSNYLNAGQEGKRWGTAHSSIVPYQAFPTADSHIMVGAGSDAQFADLAARVGRAELARDYATNAQRVENRARLVAALGAVFALKTTKEWCKVFEGCAFPFGPVNSIREVFEDEHVKEVGLVESWRHEKVGEIKFVGPAVRFSGGGNFSRSAPPLLGEHTDLVLGELLGLGEDELAKLRKGGIIQ